MTQKKPLIVVALGGNALLRRGQVMSYENQLDNVRIACQAIGKLAQDYRIAIVHGNGPQVGLLSRNDEINQEVPNYPLSNLVAMTQGMIATMLLQELRKATHMYVTSIITRVEVDPQDPAFQDPTKFIGGIYDQAKAQELAQQYHWQIKPDGDYYRRVVASPSPVRVLEVPAIQTALDAGHIVICCGGGGIPVSKDQEGELINTDCVIDKDATASMLSSQLGADFFLILTDADGVYLNYGKPNQRKLDKVSISELASYQFDKGSMQPKVDAVIDFVKKCPHGKSVIANLTQCADAIEGKAGTIIVAD